VTFLTRYVRWLHTQWPAGHVESLPVTDEEGRTNVPGLYVVGDLRGIPLLKFSAHTGAGAIRAIANDPAIRAERDSSADDPVDVAIVGAGVAGMSAALEARKHGLTYRLFEATEPFSTIVNFPKGKTIYTYPRGMTPDADLRITAEVKEELLAELRRQTIEAGVEPEASRVESVRRHGGLFAVKRAEGGELLARRAVIALGRSGNFRKLGVPGESLDKVYNRLHDPKDFCGQKALVVGGGDSALETAIALALCGGEVTLSYRKRELARPKPENVEKVQRLTADPMADDVSIEDPSSERVTTSAAGFLGEHRKAGALRLRLGTQVKEIRETEVELASSGGETETLENDVVFSMIGREPPLDFFRRSGVSVAGDRGAKFFATLAAFVAFLWFVYHWKAGGGLTTWWAERDLFPFQFLRPDDPASFFGMLRVSAGVPAFWYTLVYSALIVGFGVRRIRRRRTPYVRAQTLTLMAIQVIPLFVLPNLLLPWMGHNGLFGDRQGVATIPGEQVAAWREVTSDHPGGDATDRLAEVRARGLMPPSVVGWGELSLEKSWGDRLLLRANAPGSPTREATLRLADARIHVRDDTAPVSRLAEELFPASEWDPHGREYWRASGFILAWPLFIWNAFTERPLGLWLAIGFVQTFVLIPLIIRFWGKGAYCGWICSCGGLAETLGDAHRHKMPHGPIWNRVNVVGQVILAIAVILMGLRIAGWMLSHDHWVNAAFMGVLYGKTAGWSSLPFPFGQLNYKWFVDLFLVGIVGTGLYFHYSGRVWCRFACPLAALMHVYARFSRFRIFADKKKCISCNLCTSVCHQGIDIMNFANKGMPMEDPECVRCSACVQTCPTGVLTFGRIDREGRIAAVDRLPASPVQMREAS
jgi:thioredoxin reductase/ferredoxin